MLWTQEAKLAPVGTTGNVTGTAVKVVNNADRVALQFVVEAIGATPTVTFKFQGSLDGTNWYDVSYITPLTSTEAVAAIVVTTVVGTAVFLGNSVARGYAYYRVVTTVNTNVTFRAELWSGTNVS